MQHNPDESKLKSNDELLEVARKRFQLAEEAEAEFRKEAADDLKFSAGDQWDPNTKVSRNEDGRPCLTINRLPQSIHQVTNDQRQNRPAVRVSPVDDNADVEIAKVYQGIIRHIERYSNADTAYDTAFDSSSRCGLGYFRIITEYSDPFSFDQDIKFKRIPDRFAVRMDPNYQEPDGSDANYAFVEEKLTKDDFKAQYPSSKLCEHDDWDSIRTSLGDWITKDSVRVTEYFYKEYRETTICLVVNELGEKVVVEKDQLPVGTPMRILGERRTLVPIIKWCKINGFEVLEETEWPGRWIPIIPVLGEELVIEGKRILSGIVRHAKDPQRMYNVWASAEAETIGLAPRTPFIGAEGQFEGYEAQWSQANRRNFAFLQYRPVSLNGQLAPPPQRQVYEPPVQAISQARMLSSEDLKATTGIYDAALGAKSNETSGKAIQRRSAQAQTSNFHLIDNLSKSIRHAGRILVDLIPKIYDTDRAVRILGEDNKEEIIRINQEFERNGKKVTYRLDVGKYDVSVDTGPSFETKRQEAVASMMDFTRSLPQQAAMAADLLVGNMDWPGAKELAERLRKTLPPGLVDDKNQPQQLPPEAQAQMQQMNQMIEQLTERLNAAQDKIQNKTLELESRERIAMAQIERDYELKLADIGHKDAIFLLQQELAEIRERQAQLRFDQPIQQDFEGAGPDEGYAPIDPQQPTGGPTPGYSME